MSKRDFSPIAASLVLIAALFLLTITSLEGQPGRFFLGTADARPTEIGADGTTYMRVGPTGAITFPNSATMTLPSGTAVTGQVLTLPQINDTSSDHQYVFAVSELAADRTVTLPLLTGADTFTFNNFAATLANKTLTSPVINTSITGTADDWSTPAFNAADYDAAGAETWTVEEADVVVRRQRSFGSQACFSVVLNTTSVSGAAATLSMATGITAAASGQSTMNLVDDSATSIGIVSWTASSATVTFSEIASAWGAATNTTAVRGSWCMEI